MPRQCKAELIFAVKHSRQKINSLHGALLHDVSERNLIKSRKTVAFARRGDTMPKKSKAGFARLAQNGHLCRRGRFSAQHYRIKKPKKGESA